MRVDKFKDSTALQGIWAQSILTNDKFGFGKEIGNVTTSNVTTKFREAFETYTPGQYWTEAKASGDLIFLDGNTVGSSYLVISKDPINLGTETTLTSVVEFDMPIEASFGLSMSQRTLGQEFSIEVVDTGIKSGDVIATLPEIAISAIQQATTTLTITTATAHGLKVGQRFGVYGCTDSRMNYTALVVATIVSSTQFTATAGPGGTIPSVTAGPFASGYIYPRPALGYAKSGVSMIFENTSTTNASFYARADAGDALPSGTLSGAHNTTTGSTASVVPVTSPYTYSFQPTTEFKLAMQADRVQWADASVDTTGQSLARFTKTQVIPNHQKNYAIRFRAATRKGASTPVAKIVSAAKTGTTTATVVTDVAHGLTTGDYVNLYGNRDTTNFANLTTATVVASVVNATTFTIVWGSAVTATGYGGVVYRVNGSNTATVMGAVAANGSTITCTAGIVTLVGAATFASLLNIGDTINLHGVRSAVDGSDLGYDGAYRVRNLATTTIELEAIDGRTPATIATTNCGGAVIRRTDLRISFVRMFAYERERVEIQARPANDMAPAVPVDVKGGAVAVSQPNASSLKADVAQGLRGTVTQGTGWFFQPDNAVVGDITSAALTTTTTTSAITPTPLGGAASFNIAVTLVSGTSPTLDVGIEESDDTGTNWYRIYDFPRITQIGSYRSPVIPLSGNRIRYVQTVGGTTPSFTRSLNRQVHLDVSPKCFRQWYDRTLAIGTVSTAGSTLLTNGAKNLMLTGMVSVVGTTSAVVVLQGLVDQTWVEITGASITLSSAGTPISAVVPNMPFEAVRLYVKTAGVGQTLSFLHVKAFD